MFILAIKLKKNTFNLKFVQTLFWEIFVQLRTFYAIFVA